MNAFQLAEEVSKQLTVPTIGIGAGAATDGQVLVYHDLLTYGVDRVPKFVKPFANIDVEAMKGLKEYINQVKAGTFPEEAYTFTMKEEELEALYGGKK